MASATVQANNLKVAFSKASGFIAHEMYVCSYVLTRPLQNVINCKSFHWALGRWTLTIKGVPLGTAAWKSPLLLTIMDASQWCRRRHPLPTKTRSIRQVQKQRRPSPPAEILVRDKDFTSFWDPPTRKLCEKNVDIHAIEGSCWPFKRPLVPDFKAHLLARRPFRKEGLDFRVAVPREQKRHIKL